MSKRSGLQPAQIEECLSVLNNGNRVEYLTGWIRVKGMSKPAFDWLKREGYIEKDCGRYYPKNSRSTLGPHFNIDWRWLPVDFLWQVVEPMLTNGEHAGYSIVAKKEWGRLNLYSKGQHGYTDANEECIVNILLELAAYGYIWFQFCGSIWCIDKRKDSQA